MNFSALLNLLRKAIAPLRGFATFSRSISRTLGRVPSLWFAVLYILCIPAFAWQFSRHSGQFYYPSASSEYSSYANLPRLLVLLKNDYLDNYRRVTGKPAFFEIDGWHYDLAGVRFLPSLIDTKEGTLSVAMYFDGERQVRLSNGPGSRKINVRCIFRLVTSVSLDTTSEDLDTAPYFYRYVQIDSIFGPTNKLSEKLLPLDPDVKDIAFGAPTMRVSPPLELLIRRVEQDITGSPPGITTQPYWRMLYFSATTITTVGFGDIVPVSRRTRALVGLEAFLGVLLIGLFLNSLSHER